MSQENVDIIRRGYEAFAQGGIEAVMDFVDSGLVSPDLKWIPPRDAPTAGIYRGRDQVEAEFHEWSGQFEDYGGSRTSSSTRAIEFSSLGTSVDGAKGAAFR